MPRRRFPLHLHHSDTLLMMLAVLAATSFCWVVIALTKGSPQPTVAYTVEAPGLRLPAGPAGELLRHTVSRADQATASVVTSEAGVTVGVTPIGYKSEAQASAEQLALRIAKRLRAIDWSVVHQKVANEQAQRLYEVDVLLRDAMAERRRLTAEQEPQRLALALQVTRLLRQRSALLANSSEAPVVDPGDLTGRIALAEHPWSQPRNWECGLAVSLFGVLAATAFFRWRLGRPAFDPAARRRIGEAPHAVRPLSGLVFAKEPGVPQPSAADPPATKRAVIDTIDVAEKKIQPLGLKRETRRSRSNTTTALGHQERRSQRTPRSTQDSADAPAR